MHVQALKLKETRFGSQWFDQVEDRWDYADMQADPRWRQDWISMDCAYYRVEDDRVYLGITSFAAEIFKAYDRRTRQFVDLGYDRVADPYDAKFHRSLAPGGDGNLYAAIALLHDVDEYLDAPGSAIVRYNPDTGDLAKLGIPLPHVYIQSLICDPAREMLYGLCFPPEYLIAYSLRTGEVRTLGLVGGGYGGMAQGENIVLDDAGGVWCGSMLTRAWQSSPGVDATRLCKYDPRADRINFYRTGLPWPDGRPGFAKVEGLFNFGDGAIYASGANGSFYRIDPATGEAAFLFTPTPDRRSRLSSMVKGADGYAYGITGRDGQCELLRVDFAAGAFEKLGAVRDASDALWQCHDIVQASDGTFYVCENDNPYRSSFLWEITL